MKIEYKNLLPLKSIVLLIVVLAFALLNSGCKKQLYHNEVSGTVIDSITSLPLAGATVSLIEQESEFNLIPSYGDIILQVTTGIDGKFSFEYKSKRRHGYSYTVYKEGYYTAGERLTERKLFGKKIETTIYLVPNAYLKIHYKNAQPFDEYDYIQITGWESATGANVNNTTEAKVINSINFVYQVVWVVIKNNVQTNHSGSIYCPPGDTTLFHIYY